MSGEVSAVWVESLLPVGGRDHLVAAGLEAQPQGPQERRVVVDHQHLGHDALPADSMAGGDTLVRGRHRRGRVGGRRQGEDEPGPAAGTSSTQMSPAVGLDEGLGDGQAEARPAPGVEADEPVEDRLSLGERDAGPASVTDSATRSPAPPGGHGDQAPRRGVAVGIVEEVSQYLADEEPVDVHVGQVRRPRRCPPVGRPSDGREGRRPRRPAAGAPVWRRGGPRARRRRCGSCRAGWSPGGSAGRSPSSMRPCSSSASSSDSDDRRDPPAPRRPPSWWPAACAGRGRPRPSARGGAGRPPPAAPTGGPARGAGPAPGPGRRGWRRCAAGPGRPPTPGIPRRASMPTGRPEAVRATVRI